MAKQHHYSPVVKRTFAAPPTDDMRMKAVKVVWEMTQTRDQFMEEIEMLGLKDLVTS